MRRGCSTTPMLLSGAASSGSRGRIGEGSDRHEARAIALRLRIAERMSTVLAGQRVPGDVVEEVR